MTDAKFRAAFGAWKSPVSARTVADTAVSLGGLTVDGEDVYWLEGRPAEAGRTVLVRHTGAGPEDAIPRGYSARSRVHEYGGGAAAVSGGAVHFVNFEDQRIHALDRGSAPEPLTGDTGDRHADMIRDAGRARLICVRERHAGADVSNELIGVDLATGRSETLVAGHDFVSNPRLSPDGAFLAWISWELPDMPWDATSLWVSRIGPDGRPSDPRRIAGGPGESVFQPEWSGDGTLVFASDRSGWWNLYRWDGAGTTPVVSRDAEFGVPQWAFGMRTYDILPSGDIVAAYSENGAWRLARAAQGRLRDIEVPYTDISAPQGVGDDIVFIGASPRDAPAVIRCDPRTGATEVLKSSLEAPPDPAGLSAPAAVAFATAGGGTAYGFHYPPCNAAFEGPPGARPPLIVRGHGGPTGAASASLSLAIQYWTSRGFAVLDVNYRGSAGFGRRYREALYGEWGVADVDDMVAGAEYLAARGFADPERLIIRGGSAGGYTALAALAFRDTFSAGASLYGIGDLMTLARDTHKFESRYLDRLIGPLPEAESVYRDRSPIGHVDDLNCPVIFLQGEDDRVVPPNQAEAMVAALDRKGIPVAYIAFEGEGHGFRRAENVCRALECELAFYGRVFGFAPADDLPELEIRNLDDWTTGSPATREEKPDEAL